MAPGRGGAGGKAGAAIGPAAAIQAEPPRRCFFQNKEERREACAARGAQSSWDWPGLRGLQIGWAKMEGSLEGGGLSGPGGPQTNGETTETWKEMQSRVQETLEWLSPQELRKFRAILQKMDEEPRVTELKLELEGGSTRGLAGLLAKHYHPWAAPRVLIKVLRQLPRTDLLPRWQSDPADGQGEPGAEVVLAGRGLPPCRPARRFPAGPQGPLRAQIRGRKGGWVGVSEPGGCEHRGTNGTCGREMG